MSRNEETDHTWQFEGDQFFVARRYGCSAGCAAAIREAMSSLLHAIDERGLPLPHSAQETVYEGSVPLARADFFYDPKILVFVDGSPHQQDYVRASDHTKRRRLRALGYRPLIIQGKNIEEGLYQLAHHLER